MAFDDGLPRFIISFSSVSARNGNIGRIDDTAAKGASEAVTRKTAREFTAYRVRADAVAPPPVRMPMLATVGEDGIEAMAHSTLFGRIAESEGGSQRSARSPIRSSLAPRPVRSSTPVAVWTSPRPDLPAQLCCVLPRLRGVLRIVGCENRARARSRVPVREAPNL